MRETPFLIWSPPLDEDCQLDQALENLHQATELLDYSLYSGQEFDAVLDCLNRHLQKSRFWRGSSGF